MDNIPDTNYDKAIDVLKIESVTGIEFTAMVYAQLAIADAIGTLIEEIRILNKHVYDMTPTPT